MAELRDPQPSGNHTPEAFEEWWETEAAETLSTDDVESHRHAYAAGVASQQVIIRSLQNHYNTELLSYERTMNALRAILVNYDRLTMEGE